MTGSVLIVDEDALLGGSLGVLLGEEDGLRVAAVVEQCPDDFDGRDPVPVDVALVSSELADGTFLPVCRELAARCTVLVLSKRDHERTLMRRSKQGPSGPSPPTRLTRSWSARCRPRCAARRACPEGCSAGCCGS